MATGGCHALMMTCLNRNYGQVWYDYSFYILFESKPSLVKRARFLSVGWHYAWCMTCMLGCLIGGCHALYMTACLNRNYGEVWYDYSFYILFESKPSLGKRARVLSVRSHYAWCIY